MINRHRDDAGMVSTRSNEAEVFELCADPDATVTTACEPVLAAGDGRMTLPDHAESHAAIVAHRPGKDPELTDLPGGRATGGTSRFVRQTALSRTNHEHLPRSSFIVEPMNTVN